MSILININKQKMNLIQNFNTIDQNILGYGLLLGSLSIISYSVYYFSGYLTNNTLSTVTPNLNAETFTQRLVENLENYQHLNLDTKVPTMSNFKDVISQGINTDVAKLVDSAVQTDEQLLYDYLKELLYNTSTPVTSLAEISPIDFISQYKNDPVYADYFAKTANWAESISRQSSTSSANSEILFLSKIKEDLKSIPDLIQNSFNIIEIITQLGRVFSL
jgi:hypothetical protein